MKANIRRGVVSAGQGPFHGHELRLTIGIIVRNEEKTLEKCLSALRELREQVPSELIVTDTGSTDRTVEIARRYTDRILRFEWCDDFAAARNTGLFAAKGDWFLFLDADEWFDDTEEIIRFFNSGECDRYGTGSFIVRNYSDWQGKNYIDFHACRMFRMYPGIHFKNRVHEDIQILRPTKMLDTFVHHYGYVFHNLEEKDRKTERNLMLLHKELQEEPENLKVYSQIAGQYLTIGENEKAAFYAEQGLELAEKQPPGVRSLELALHRFRARFNLGRYGWILEEMDRHLAKENVRNVFHLEELWYAQTAAFHLQQYPKALEYARLYLGLYADYEAGRLDKTLLMYAVFEHVSAWAKESCLMTMTRTFLAMDNTEEAVRTFRKLNFSGDSFLSNGSLPLCFELTSKTKDYSLLADFSRACLAADEKNGESAFANYAELYQRTHPAEAERIRLTLAESGLGSYSRLCRLREAKPGDGSPQARGILDQFERSEEKLRVYESDVLYYAMAEGRDTMPLLLRTDADDFIPFAMQAVQAHPEFADLVEKYAGRPAFRNTLELRWLVCALECVLLSAAENGEPQRCLRLFDVYIRQCMKLIRATYRPEALEKTSLAALPRKVRFACLAVSALAARDSADGTAYLSELRAALKENPAMEKPVQFLLDRFREEQEEREKKAREFARLAKQVKSNIETLIARGELVKAGQITAQLSALMPNDGDVRRYQKLTHTEPTMREIASHLPQ